MQNQSLREELAALKTQLATAPQADVIDDPPPKYEPEDTVARDARREHRRNVASSCNSDYFLKHDDADADSLERAAMTHSVSVNKQLAIATSTELSISIAACTNCRSGEQLPETGAFALAVPTQSARQIG